MLYVDISLVAVQFSDLSSKDSLKLIAESDNNFWRNVASTSCCNAVLRGRRAHLVLRNAGLRRLMLCLLAGMLLNCVDRCFIVPKRYSSKACIQVRPISNGDSLLTNTKLSCRYFHLKRTVTCAVPSTGKENPLYAVRWGGAVSAGRLIHSHTRSLITICALLVWSLIGKKPIVYSNVDMTS